MSYAAEEREVACVARHVVALAAIKAAVLDRARFRVVLNNPSSFTSWIRLSPTAIISVGVRAL
jgi:hypothetical protein